MRDVTLKSVPDEVGEKELKEWVSVLVERNENKKLAPPEANVLAAQTVIDTYRKANTLKAKYEKEVVEETL